MIEPTLANFRILFPEFDAIDDVRIQLYIDDAIDELSKANWGKCWGKAVLYYAAHQLQLSIDRIDGGGGSGGGSGSQSGKLTSASADGLSVGFAQSPASGSSDWAYWLSLTPYGQTFLALANSCLPKMRLVAC